MAKIHVKFSQGQLKMIRKLKGEMGDTDSEVVRSVVVSWLSEKSLVAEFVKQKLKKKN